MLSRPFANGVYDRNERDPLFRKRIFPIAVSVKKQIKLLELAIQHGEEKKVDYDLIDYAIGTYRDIVQTGLLTVEEYAASANETEVASPVLPVAATATSDDEIVAVIAAAIAMAESENSGLKFRVVSFKRK